MRLARPLASVVVLGLLLAGALAQDAAPPKQGPPGGGAADPLVAALKSSPGCMGVEVAFTQSRKAVVFAWFKDKEATLDWYYSEYHQGQMAGLEAAAAASPDPSAEKSDSASDAEPREPLGHVPDDVGPILCIATITPGGKQQVPGFPQSISQISIELYAPLPGGLAFNGKFAPDALKVPHMIEIAPPPAPKSAEPAAPAAPAKSSAGQ